MTLVDERPVRQRGGEAPPVRPRPRVWLALAVTLAVLVAAEVGVRLVEHRLPPPGGWVTEEYPQKIDQIEELAAEGGASLVFLGSSVVDVSIDPSLLGPDASGPRGAYNAGIVAASPVITEVWARELVVPALRPDVAVVAVSSRDLNGNGKDMRARDAQFRTSPGGAWLLGTQSVADRLEWWWHRHSALVRHRSSLRRPLEALAGYDPPDRDRKQITELGFETEMADQPFRFGPAVEALYRDAMVDFSVTRDQLDALRRLVGHMERSGIRVVLLDVPVTDDYVALHPREEADMAAYEAAVDAVAAETGAEVLRPGRWPRALFADALHLNGDGARRLTAEVGAYLAAGR